MRKPYIVSENVLNELQRRVWDDLVENDLLLIARCRLELLLNKARPMLIAAEFHDVPENVLDNGYQYRKMQAGDRSLERTFNSHLRDLFARNSSSKALLSVIPGDPSPFSFRA